MHFSIKPETLILMILLQVLLPVITSGQNEKCNIINRASAPGESLSYIVSYNVFIFWTDVGVVNFTISEVEKDKHKRLYLHATGLSFPTWNWFFKVEDSYESWTDPVTLKPYEFIRDVYEGGYEIDIHYNFDREQYIAMSTSSKTNKAEWKDTIKITECTYDVLSIIYYTRNIDYSAFYPGDTIPVTILLDNELTNIYFRYLGKENIRVRGFGKFRCIKFSVYLVEGTLFEGGEDMEVWVTDDENRIPLKINSPILIGSVKARIISMKGVKHPLNSRISKKSHIKYNK